MDRLRSRFTVIFAACMALMTSAIGAFAQSSSGPDYTTPLTAIETSVVAEITAFLPLIGAVLLAWMTVAWFKKLAKGLK